MGLGTPKIPINWVLGSSSSSSELFENKNELITIKNTIDKKLIFFQRKDIIINNDVEQFFNKNNKEEEIKK
ncbi:hypothetical protein Mgra_00002289 [Meloidogyne graminicola]|uniref:Uncharacterized protein n=1 Tax=Meloidogyne graminicola TaxID=189291 RepID=A0A8S9ZYU8_9BILA|nr:hypothetical protein Mgra_00002289 [Meloidogyne graminicola]